VGNPAEETTAHRANEVSHRWRRVSITFLADLTGLAQANGRRLFDRRARCPFSRRAVHKWCWVAETRVAWKTKLCQ
jgi:hypothetical protein